MEAIALRRAAGRVPDGVLTGAAVTGAGLFGVLLAARPAWAAALVGAVLFVTLLRADVVLAIAFWIPMTFVTTVPYLATTFMLLAICAVWAGRLLSTRGSIGSLLPGRRFLVGALILLLAWLLISLAWARDAGMGWYEMRSWLIAAAVFLVTATTVAETRQVKVLLAAFVAGALISVVVGALGGGPDVSASAMVTSKGRFMGAEENPNDLAAQLVPAIILAAVLASGARRTATRWALGSVIAALTLALVATQSRGGMIAAGVAAAAAIVAHRRRAARTGLAVAGLAVVAVIGVALFPGAGHRVTHLGDGGAGRTTEWRVALRMADAHPVTGVGLNNFRVVGRDYVGRPGGLRDVGRIVDRPHVAHSTYLGLLAETGIVGLGAFLAVLAACLGGVTRAARVFERRGDSELAGLSWGVALAALAELVAQLFQSNARDTRLWVLLAVAVALAAIARRQPGRLTLA